MFCVFFLQRQDTDERLHRLQTDKESLALQVQVLTEQVSAQNEKITDLEKLITDKSQLITNTEDLLQRVSEFAISVGIQIDKQKVLITFLSFFISYFCFSRFLCIRIFPSHV